MTATSTLSAWLQRPVTQRALMVLLLAGALVAVALNGRGMKFFDEREYNRLGMVLLQQHAYLDEFGRPTSYRPPGYPMFLAALYAVKADPLIGRILNAILLLVAALLLRSLVQRDSLLGASLVIPLLACCPLLVYTSSTLYPQTLCLALMALAIWMVTRREATFPQVIAAGLVYGLLILVASSFLLLAVIPAMYLIFFSGRARSARIGLALAFVVAAATAVAPWTWRNWQVHGALVPVSTNGGINLLLGNSENAGPNSGTNTNVDHYREQAKGMTEIDIDAYFRRSASEWMQANPRATAELYVLKVLNYFNYRNEVATAGVGGAASNALVFVTYYPVLLIVVVRLSMMRRVPLTPIEWLLAALYFGNAILSAVFFTRLRFRAPFDGLLAALAALAIARWWPSPAGVSTATRCAPGRQSSLQSGSQEQQQP